MNKYTSWWAFHCETDCSA